MEIQKIEGSHFDALWHIPFGRHFLSLIRESADWERVYLRPDVAIDPFMPLTQIPTFTPDRAAGHRIVAYRRRAAVGRATEKLTPDADDRSENGRSDEHLKGAETYGDSRVISFKNSFNNRYH